MIGEPEGEFIVGEVEIQTRVPVQLRLQGKTQIPGEPRVTMPI